MKILLSDTSSERISTLAHWLEFERGHAVFLAVAAERMLLYDLLEVEPDLAVLVGKQSLAPASPSDFPDCAILEVSEFDPGSGAVPESLLHVLTRREGELSQRKFPAREFSADQRIVVHDESLLVANRQKLHRPERSPEWANALRLQERQFVLQMQTALSEGRHGRALRYLASLESFDRGLLRESAYRLAHGSYKISWLRDQIARWMTVLAHYCADCELDHCPPPHNASPNFAFVRARISPVSLYPIACAVLPGITPVVREQIFDAAGWAFSGQGDEEIAADGMRLFGVCAYLSQVARAQVRLFSQLIDRDSEFHRSEELTCGVARDIGVYMEFRGWYHLKKLGPQLSTVAANVLGQVRRVEQRSRFCPTLSLFLKTLQVEIRDFAQERKR